jgi:glycosyltransferase involved in cell wall biosynthesis
MRIGVIVDRLEVDGVEKVAIQQVASLRELGHEAELVLLRRRGEGLRVFADALESVPMRVLERRLPRVLRGSVPIPGFAFLQTFHLTYPAFARSLVRRGEFDRLLAHGTYTCPTAFAVGRARSIPVAAFIWDPTYHVLSSAAYSERALTRFQSVLLPMARRFDRWLARRADLIVLGGTAYRNYLDDLGARKTLVSYPAVTPAEEPRSASARAREMLAVTAWKQGKDPERLLALLEHAKDFTLVLAGAWLDPRLRADFEREVQRRNLGHRVEVTGALSQDELSERYARACFVIQTWPSPGFGLSPLEAAARGTTFVAPSAQGSGEIFRNGTHGFLYATGDEEALISAVDRLARDVDQAVAMGENAWNWVRGRHTWKARATELAKALEEMP